MKHQVSAIAATLRSPPHLLPIAVLSIDDLYLPHAAQTLLASSHPLNALVQHRGEPGTHDVALGVSLFSALKAHQRARIPAYDKSAYNGQGDRMDEGRWEEVNVPGGPAKVQIVIFEGWCVGFRALGSNELRLKWERAQETKEGTLWKHRLEDLEFVNEKLRDYDALTEYALQTCKRLGIVLTLDIFLLAHWTRLFTCKSPRAFLIAPLP